jgi:hypothetical protein
MGTGGCALSADTSLPLDDFIQAVQSQLDSAQAAMAVKARNLDLPLTFAIKDISLDLRAHVEYARSEIRIRPAGPNDKEASTFHLVFTAITRPMIEENAIAFSESPEERPIEDLKEDLSEEDRKRLEWIGVRTVSKLRELQERGGENAVGRIAKLPVERLRRALERASAPMVEHILPVDPEPGSADLPNLVRIRGRNLVREGLPRVTVGDEPVSVVRAGEREVVIAPRPHQMAGRLTIEPAPRLAATASFDLRPARPAPEGPHPEGGTP